MPEKFDVGDIIQKDTIKGIIIDRNDKTKEYGIIWNSRERDGLETNWTYYSSKTTIRCLE